MKKILAISVLALAAAASSNAKTADELRVYINPGHGSWTANDRPAQVIGHSAYSRYNTDTLSFFETNTNLRKGFGVLEMLREYGLKFDPTLNQTGERWQIGAARDLSNNIVMSHVKCGPYLDDNATPSQYDAMIQDILDKLNSGNPGGKKFSDLTSEQQEAKLAELTADERKRYDDNRFLRDVVAVRYNRNLSEICAEVTANNFDMFISIHSNAASEGTATNYPLYLYGGYDAIKEGSGHATSERQTLSKAMAQASWKYAYENPHMVWSAYTATNMNIRGDMNFYSTTSTNGYLGALKHSAPGFLVEGYFHTYQPARHRAMNWDVDFVEGVGYARGIADYFGLEKEKTGIIYGIVRDKNEKFKDDVYKPSAISADAYKPINGATVTLRQGETVVATYTTDDQYNGAYVFKGVQPGKYTITVTHPDYLDSDPTEVEVKAAQNAYPSISIVNKDWTPPTIFYENYPEVKVPGTLAADEYEFKQTYVDEPVAELEGKTVRRVIAKDNTLYILAHDAEKVPTIIVYDGIAKSVLANVSTEGTQGTVATVSDIQLTADGILVATNENLNHYGADQVQAGETRGYNRLYRWENDENGIPTGTPVEFGKSTLTGNFLRAYVGGSMAFSGTMADGQIIVPCYSAATVASHKFFYNIYTIVDGEIASAAFNNKPNETYLTLEKLGDYNFTTSPLDKDAFIATGTVGTPAQFGFRDVVGTVSAMPEEFSTGSRNTAFFRYDGHSYMVVADNAEGKNAGVKLIDITAGVDKPAAIGTINTSLPETADASVAGSIVAVKDAEENVTAAYINLYAVREGKISRMTTEGVTVNASPVGMAYDLVSEKVSDSEYKLSFKATEDAKDAYAVLTPASGEGETVTIPLGAISKGDNSVNISDTDIEAGVEYNWAIELVSKTVPVSGLIKSEKNSLSVRGGIVNITDPSQAAFGRTIVTHGKVNGFDIYDAAGNKLADKIHKQHKNISTVFTNQSDPFKGSEYNGYAVFPCWGDKASGIIMLDADKYEEDPFSLFRNGKNDGTGNHVLDGVNLGGGAAGACIIGEPDNARLYSFSEDHEGLNGKGATENGLVYYELSAFPWAVTKAPTVLPSNGYKSMLANQSANLIPYKNGFFAVQARGAGNQVVGCPGFIYVSAADNAIKFNSGNLEDLPSVQNGLAITPDGKTLAVCMASNIAVYDVTWEGDTPTLTYRYTVNSGATTTHTHLSFDYAGNLHMYKPSSGYYIYSLAQENPTVSTPARAEYSIKVSTGVEEIGIEDAENNAPVEYFNINGVRMNAENLLPGIYIKRQGKKVEKVLIK